MNSRERYWLPCGVSNRIECHLSKAASICRFSMPSWGVRIFCPKHENERIGLDNLLVEFLPPIFGEYAVHNGINFLAKPLLLTRADLDKMVFPDPEDPKFYQAAEAIIQRNRGQYAIAAKMRLGASAMLMSMGLEAFSYALADDPGLVDAILGRYVDWTIAIVRHLKDLGVDLNLDV